MSRQAVLRIPHEYNDEALKQLAGRKRDIAARRSAPKGSRNVAQREHARFYIRLYSPRASVPDFLSYRSRSEAHNTVNARVRYASFLSGRRTAISIDSTQNI